VPSPAYRFLQLYGIVSCTCRDELHKFVSLSGPHLAGCAHGSNVVLRHDKINSQLTEAIQEGNNTRIIREPRSMIKGYGQGGPDLMFTPATGQQKIIIDTTVASRPDHNINLKKPEPLAAARRAAHRKIKAQPALDKSFKFVPFAMQYLGGMDGRASAVLKRYVPSRCLPEHLEPESFAQATTTRRFFEIAIAVANAKYSARNALVIARKIKDSQE
jgi:hypothetical protein